MMTKRTKVAALAKHGATEGERQAAVAALGRLPQTKRQRLTGKVVAALPRPAQGNRVYRDGRNARGNDYVQGFGVRVTAGDNRSFIYNYVSPDGVERRKTIGAWPVLTVEAARAEARKLAAQVALGGDPLQEEREERGAQTVNELCDLFLREHAARRRPLTVREYTNIVEHDIRPALGNRQIGSIQRYDIQELHNRVTDRGATFQANRVLAVCTVMFNFAIDRKLCTVNPAQRIKRNAEPHRERYLSADELRRIHPALVAHKDRDFADLIRLLLLTGARSGETLKARWSDFDLKAGVWLKPAPTTKQDRRHRVHLSAPALEILQGLRARHPANDVLVFYGMTPRKVGLRWNALLKAAQIKDFRKHDLRHSFASVTISEGFGLADVGALLGHSNPATTARYAHLLPNRLQEAADAAARALAPKPDSER
jgi:integrase